MKSKYVKFVLLSSIIYLSLVKTIVSQTTQPCGAMERSEQLHLLNPELKKEYDFYMAELKKHSTLKSAAAAAADTTIYTIPIVFHVLHINGPENIPDADIIAQVDRLNIDYRRLNSLASVPPYFQSIAGDARIQFKLATKDPDGNCTNGIDRIYTHKTINVDQLKDPNTTAKINQWPREKYLNVWVVKDIKNSGALTGTILGYATFPADVATTNYIFDGVVMIYTECDGTHMTLTHEIGHWLNLIHPWGLGEVDKSCDGTDEVDDTPRTNGTFQPKAPTTSTCPAFSFECDKKSKTGIYDFADVTTTSGQTDPTTPPFVSDSKIVFTPFKAVGVSANSSVAGKFSYSNWGTGALDGETVFANLTGSVNPGKYYEYTVATTPNAAGLDSVGMSFYSITFDVVRSATGPRTYVVRSSLDGFTTDLLASVSPPDGVDTAMNKKVFFYRTDVTTELTGSEITLGSGAFTASAFAPFTGVSDSITFRIYAYNAEDTAGTFGVDNVTTKLDYGDLENIQNYMDYATCSQMFTKGQIARMRTALTSYVADRNKLWLSSNLIATGTNPGPHDPCTPQADFYSSRNVLCNPTNTVFFTKNVSNITPGLPTTYQWTFSGTGVTPATSTSPGPVTVTYTTPGVYDVTLTATNSGGTSTTTKSLYINVNQVYAQVPSGDYQEDFENTTEFLANWSIDNLDGNYFTWDYISNLGYHSSHSMMMNAFKNYAYDTDVLYSPSYDLRFLNNLSLDFKCAAATVGGTTAEVNDELKVYLSYNCGASWVLARTFSAKSTFPLINNGYIPTKFVPTTPTNENQWATLTVPLTTIPSTQRANVRFKFEYVAGASGNSIYIDNININHTVGVNENIAEAANVSLFPNPASQITTLSYHLDKKANTKIELMDVVGKKLMDINNSNQPEGDYNVQISKTDLKLANGIFFIKLTVDNTTITKKLIISE